MIMPCIGPQDLKAKHFSSAFSHKDERAAAGYYGVMLKPSGIKVELTATSRVGVHRYTFPINPQSGVVVDLHHRDKTIAGWLEMKDSVTLIGYRLSEGWAKSQHIYFAMQFSKPVKRISTFPAKDAVAQANGDNTTPYRTHLRFDLKGVEPLIVKVGISSVSVAGALLNLREEAPHWDFDAYRNAAAEAWDRQLSKIETDDKDEDKLKVFYTALYHCCIHPSLNMDVDNQYRGRDNKIYTAAGFTNYSVFSLWDTYRALHPLFTIIERKRTTDFINSFLNQYKQSGRLPMWELSGNETDCMIGFHAVSVIADAMAKGIRGFDTLAAFNAMKGAAEYTAFGIPVFNRNGFLQVDDESESVSKSLEYGYDNWCIAQMARQLGRGEDEKIYLKRSLAYMNLFDVSTGHMRPRKNGGWLSPFYATEINNHFTEGNSWQYSFYVPHDVEGLIRLFNSENAFEAKLDELFNTTEKTRGRDQADVTGLIGQYAHGNEPSHHMAYLYNYIGKPQKTIDRVTQICDNFYKNAVDGLIGNEDCGQMSAWYIFSSLGFYPVCPGSTQYVIGKPRFSNIKVNLDNGGAFSIRVNGPLTATVKGLRLNGQFSTASYIQHNSILSGKELVFLDESSAGQTRQYGFESADRPRSFVPDMKIIPAPIIEPSNRVFKDSLRLNVKVINMQMLLLSLITIDGSVPTFTSPVFVKPVRIDKTCEVKFQSLSNEAKSIIVEAKFNKLKNEYDVVVESRLNAQYTAEGPQTLVDGIKGDSDWKKGNWLGCQGQDFVCVADLRQKREISYISLDCLQDTRSWIIFPKSVEYYGSNDNIKFTLIKNVASTAKADDNNVQLNAFEAKLPAKVKYRYVKVVAKNYGPLPAWHQGAGGEAFIFADELEIK
jgi:predicted alpha-1,2-mannosidase